MLLNVILIGLGVRVWWFQNMSVNSGHFYHQKVESNCLLPYVPILAVRSDLVVIHIIARTLCGF